MQTSLAVLIVLLVLLVLAVALLFLGRSVYDRPPKKGTKDPFADSPPLPPMRQEKAVGGGAATSQDEQEEDAGHSSTGSEGGLLRPSRAAAPRDLEEAQRAAWFEAVSNGDNANYNTEVGGDTVSELVQHHTPGPSINYQDTLIDIVAGARMREQHADWYKEVAPKSQTAMKVDTLDEASTVASHGGHGLYAFRFSAPSQDNPLFITDQDDTSFKKQSTKFSFGS
ncbi:hypothetical protein ElyMa_002515200 [Elysia marginata]|uniref:Uncharacterized protein n=1 Tax=Elysia marginata TaxID=1093978 RepID=A0AAV4GT31_9GAST|nr:hypothetical protein ElyMa_002515200 [Elysia marginata]